MTGLLFSGTRLLASSLASSLAALTVSPGHRERKRAGPIAPPNVEVVAVEQQDVPVYREWTGSLSAVAVVTLSARVGGYLLRQNCREGQRVKPGDLLFEIDDRPFQAALDQAMARLREAELDVQRLAQLSAGAASNKQKLEEAIQASLASKVAVEEARLNLQFTRITSPIDGVAGPALAQIGNLIGPDSGPLTTLTKIDPIRVHFSVDQQFMTEIQQRMPSEAKGLPADRDFSCGPPLELILSLGAVYPHKGRLRLADSRLDSKTGAIRVTGAFPNPRGLLRPGMFHRVRAQLGHETNVLLVPKPAVTEAQGRFLIAVVGAGNRVSIRPVFARRQVGQNWVIEGPVKAGDRVVAEGVERVREGAAVNPVPLGSHSDEALHRPRPIPEL